MKNHSEKFYFGDDLTILKEYDFNSTYLPESVVNVPGMLSIEERRMLYYFASSVYKGNGFIVDGGSFFGSSVCAMAQGLKDSPYFSKDHFSQAHGYEKPIIAYELGYLPSPKSSKIDKRRVFGGQEYILGESFVEILNKSILPYNDVVDLRIGDFNQTRWENSNIIELCFIDHAKRLIPEPPVRSTYCRWRA